MKKIIIILVCSFSLLSFTYNELDGYITLFENSNSGKYFKYGKSHYFEFFAKQKEDINNQEYYVRYRRYSWGDVDTTYYRKGNTYYYHIDKKSLKESIVLPVKPVLGDNWLENDKSWSYEVIAVDQKFKTPKKKYKDCIKVNCKQLTDRDSSKSKEFYLYYSATFGFVGNVDSQGNILSYLSEVKLNAKEGESIGGN